MLPIASVHSHWSPNASFVLTSLAITANKLLRLRVLGYLVVIGGVLARAAHPAHDARRFTILMSCKHPVAMIEMLGCMVTIGGLLLVLIFSHMM